jgi:hypothetical protein
MSAVDGLEWFHSPAALAPLSLQSPLPVWIRWQKKKHT